MCKEQQRDDEGGEDFSVHKLKGAGSRRGK
jgi:hypothetical protein